MPAKIGLIARADNGGLGNLCWEFFNHIDVSKVLIKNLDDPHLGTSNRGGFFPDRYCSDRAVELRHSIGVESTIEDFEWLCDGVDVVYTAEIPYGEHLWDIARSANTKTVLHAMPELYREGTKPDVVWIPTSWERHRLPDAAIVPVPVNTDRFRANRFRAVDADAHPHFYHIAAPAMLDRNGTKIVMDALDRLHRPCTFTIIGDLPRAPKLNKYIDLQLVKSNASHEYFDIHPVHADAFVMPRRYAGLSMPMQEAMACGNPVITTNVEPQKSWPGTFLLPAWPQPKPVRMAGGQFLVYDSQPEHLATCMRTIIDNGRGSLDGISGKAWSHAQSVSWETWAPKYHALFDKIAD